MGTLLSKGMIPKARSLNERRFSLDSTLPVAWFQLAKMATKTAMTDCQVEVKRRIHKSAGSAPMTSYVSFSLRD